MAVVLTASETDERIVSATPDQVNELLHAAKAVFHSTDACRRGLWQVPQSAFQRLVLAVEGIDPDWLDNVEKPS